MAYLSRNFGNLIPQNHSVTLSIALGNNGQELARPLLSGLESETHDTLHGVASEDRNLGCRLPRLAGVRTTTLARILAFAVLANNDPVEIPNVAVAEGRLGTPEYSSGADIGILLEGLADSQTKTPERDVIRDIYNC